MTEVHVQSGQWLVQLNESSGPILRRVLRMVVSANGMDEWKGLNGWRDWEYDSWGIGKVS